MVVDLDETLVEQPDGSGRGRSLEHYIIAGNSCRGRAMTRNYRRVNPVSLHMSPVFVRRHDWITFGLSVQGFESRLHKIRQVDLLVDARKERSIVGDRQWVQLKRLHRLGKRRSQLCRSSCRPREVTLPR